MQNFFLQCALGLYWVGCTGCLRLQLSTTMQHRKYARVICEALGKCHHNGGMAVYDALVWMARS
jgi:DNA gyrase/topoisomerase IV subunit A